jgi:hypothetical protein
MIFVGTVLYVLFFPGVAFILGLVSVSFGHFLVVSSPRSDQFGKICTSVAVLSAIGQEVWALGRLLLSGSRADFWDFISAGLLGWHLAVPPLLAALLWLISPPVPSSIARPAVAGLIFSLAVVALLAMVALQANFLRLCLLFFQGRTF